MKKDFVSSHSVQKIPLWKKLRNKRSLISFDLEITARCNNNCRHCYINLPAGDEKAKEKELSFEEINSLADEAVSLGALGCLITGGEPLLREDFFDIYLLLKKKGLLVSIFTNATLIDEGYIRFFKKYPPRNVEVTVYGITKETYEKVTRKPGSFSAFMGGLNLLLNNDIKVHLKAMVLRSNVHELPMIATFCRERTKDYFRFDPFLHLRFDGDPVRNREIKSERLSPEEIVQVEKSDPKRFQALKEGCDKLIVTDFSQNKSDKLFQCGVGTFNFDVSWEGNFRFCSSLCHPEYIYDLKTGSLADAWNNFVYRVWEMKSKKKEFLKGCSICSIKNLCIWCPANAYLEIGELDKTVEYFCKVAHLRAKTLKA